MWTVEFGAPMKVVLRELPVVFAPGRNTMKSRALRVASGNWAICVLDIVVEIVAEVA
jgi:hypothetical protein